MSDKKERLNEIFKLVSKNTFEFLKTFILINILIYVFGSSNILASVGIAVSVAVVPYLNIELKPGIAAFFIVFLFSVMSIISILSYFNPWLGFFSTLLFILLIMFLCCEPLAAKPYIPFLVTYVFCQATPVYGKELVLRIVELVLSGIIIGTMYFIKWHKVKFEPYTLRYRVEKNANNFWFILRMSMGIAIAVLIGSVFHFQKPLWISVVAMSLTQLEMKDTIERIKMRTVATVIGSVLFVVLVEMLVPPQYNMILILFLGYLCNFFSEYKHKQIINAISAINASMILMDTGAAIETRLFCLFLGILLVLSLFMAEKGIKRMTQYRKNTYMPTDSAGSEI